MSEKPSFFAELKRRNVYKVAVAYAVVGWLLMQIASQIFPFFEIPNWVCALLLLLLVIGFPIALIIAWAFEVTSEGDQTHRNCRCSGSYGLTAAPGFILFSSVRRSRSVYSLSAGILLECNGATRHRELRRRKQSEAATIGSGKIDRGAAIDQ